MAMSPDTGSSGQSLGDNATVQGVAAEMKARLGEIAEPLKNKAEEIAREQKEASTGHIRTLASAIHGAARELEAGMPKMASSVHDVAQHIEQTADDVRESNLDELMEKFDSYARQQPALVFGGAMIAGFFLSRFLKVDPDQTSKSVWSITSR